MARSWQERFSGSSSRIKPNSGSADEREKLSSAATESLTKGDDMLYSAKGALGLQPDETVNGIAFESQLQRMIYEDTPYGQNIPMAAHVVADDGVARHMRPERIARRLSCTMHDARRIADAMTVIEADTKVMSRFLTRTRELGADKLEASIVYIEKLAWELGRIEGQKEAIEIPVGYDFASQASRSGRWQSQADSLCQWPREQGGEEDPIPEARRTDQGLDEDDESGAASTEGYAYHRVGDDPDERDWLASQPITYRTLIHFVRSCTSAQHLAEIGKVMFDNNWEAYVETMKSEGFTPLMINAVGQIWKGNLTTTIKRPVGRDKNRFSELDGFTTADIRHMINLVNHGDIPRAINDTTRPVSIQESQSPKFRYICNRLSKSQVSQLLAYRDQHTPPLFTTGQRDYFWTQYRIQKAQLNPALNLNAHAQALMGKIAGAKTIGKLRWLGKNLFDYQDGTIGTPRIPHSQWKPIWKAYRERKEELTPKAATA
jgi:hypothetical protein